MQLEKWMQTETMNAFSQRLAHISHDTEQCTFYDVKLRLVEVSNGELIHQGIKSVVAQ